MIFYYAFLACLVLVLVILFATQLVILFATQLVWPFVIGTPFFPLLRKTEASQASAKK